MRQLFIVILTITAGWLNTSAQTIYQTLEGHVIIKGKYQGKGVLAESHKLNLFLNYTTKKFTGKLDLNTLSTGSDTLIQQFTKNEQEWVFFEGVIPNEDFIIWEHPKLSYVIPLEIQANGTSLTVPMDVELEHYRGVLNYACLLSGIMDVDLAAFNKNADALSDSVRIQLTQVLLKDGPNNGN